MKTYYFYLKNDRLVYSNKKPRKGFFSVEARNSDEACFYYQLACGF